MRMTQRQYDEHEDEGHGYCTKCDDISSELDACLLCGRPTVIGLEQATELEHIEISENVDDEEDGEDDDYEGGSFF